MPYSLFTTELGVAGLTVSGLVSLLALVITSGHKRDVKRTDSFQDALAKLYEMQKEERDEWRLDTNKRDSEWRREVAKRDKEMSAALAELTKAVNELANSYRS
jgi:hypothetical protein